MTASNLKNISTRTLFAELERRIEEMRVDLHQIPDEVNMIVDCVCDAFSVTRSQIFSGSRNRHISWARMAALTLINAAGYTLANSAAFFKLDHCAVVHAKKRIGELCATERIFRDRLSAAATEITLHDHHIDLILPPALVATDPA